MPKFDERRSSPRSLFLRAPDYAVFVAPTKRADTADIVNGQQIIKRVERLRLLFSFTAELLSAFDLIAHYDAPCPPVGLGVGNRGMEERTVFRRAMEV
jgi:hypothetical protein